MTGQQTLALDKLYKLHHGNPDAIALIICGSIARKEERNDSDIDLYLVVTDEAFEKVERTKSYFYGTWDPNEFFGVGIDGKIVGMRFLREAVTHASDPTRVSFQSAYTLFSRSPEIDELIGKIPVYPEREHEERIRAFYAYVKQCRYIGEDAFKQGNEFWFQHCVMELIFFAGRLVLAHNHRLFPCHKALFKALGQCGNLPPRFIEASHHLLNHMTIDEMLAYYEMVIDFFKAYDFPDNERIGLILENEWTWYTGRITVGEW